MKYKQNKPKTPAPTAPTADFRQDQQQIADFIETVLIPRLTHSKWECRWPIQATFGATKHEYPVVAIAPKFTNAYAILRKKVTKPLEVPDVYHARLKRLNKSGTRHSLFDAEVLFTEILFKWLVLPYKQRAEKTQHTGGFMPPALFFRKAKIDGLEYQPDHADAYWPHNFKLRKGSFFHDLFEEVKELVPIVHVTSRRGNTQGTRYYLCVTCGTREKTRSARFIREVESGKYFCKCGTQYLMEPEEEESPVADVL